MDTLGVSESLWRKIGAAVGIQYAGVLALAIVPIRVSGTAQTLSIGVLLAATTLAVGNTVIIIYQDIIEPIETLESVGATIAKGDLDVEPRPIDQQDELGSLFETTNDMIETLTLIESQAKALRDEQFDEAVFDDPTAGEMGALIEDMRQMVEQHVRTIEEDRERYSLLNHLLTHDVANEVLVIKGFAGQLQANRDGDPVEIGETIERAATNIEEIIDMARTLEQDASTVAVDVVSILNEEIDDIMSTHHEAVVESPDVTGSIPVQGNILLHAVFRNLLINGIEHNPVQTPAIETAIEKADGQVVVHVSDNGSGIDDPDSVFERAEPGSGLDLIRRIVDQFDGSVDVWDDETRGTTFEVSLNAA